jgi:hypothetical protein
LDLTFPSREAVEQPAEGGAEPADLLQMGRREACQQALGLGRESDQDAPPVLGIGLAPDEAQALQPVEEPDAL